MVPCTQPAKAISLLMTSANGIQGARHITHTYHIHICMLRTHLNTQVINMHHDDDDTYHDIIAYDMCIHIYMKL